MSFTTAKTRLHRAIIFRLANKQAANSSAIFHAVFDGGCHCADSTIEKCGPIAAKYAIDRMSETALSTRALRHRQHYASQVAHLKTLN
jgi:hypothetical protein